MRIIYHIGLHSTDEDAALRCLLQNSEPLAAAGTAVPEPARFRPVLRETMIRLRGRPADAATQEHVLDAITDLEAPERVVFSSDSFLCVPQRAIQGAQLYPLAQERAPWIRNLFPDHPAEFAFALRNPATLIPTLHRRFADEEEFGAYLARIEPEALSWVAMVERFRSAVPDCPITLWCNEDSPLIWPEILGALSGAEAPGALAGADDLLAELMSEEGRQRLQDYLASHPPGSAEHRRRILAAFLARFARAEAVELDFDLPDWTSERIARLTERYEADVARIAGMEGIRFLAP